MSAVTKSNRYISPEEYLSGEPARLIRHDYFAGEIVPIPSSRLNHNHVAGNLFAELNLHLRRTTCEAFTINMKVHIQRGGEDWFYYPDVMVNCDPAGQHEYYCDTPSVICEVVSPATEVKDRRE